MLRLKQNKIITIFLILSLILGLGSCFGDTFKNITEHAFFKSKITRFVGFGLGVGILGGSGYSMYRCLKK